MNKLSPLTTYLIISKLYILHSNIDENNHTTCQKSIVEQVNVYQSNQNNSLNIPIKDIEIKKAIKNLKKQEICW